MTDRILAGRPNPAPQPVRSPLDNERGIALIVAISLLAVMSILGVMLLSASTSEIQLSGNFRNTQEAFYAADRAVEYATQGVAQGETTVDLYNDSDASAVPHRNRVTVGLTGLEPSAVSTADDRNSVTYIGSGPPPLGGGSDAGDFVAHNYAISVVGVSPTSSANPSRSTLRAQVAKIVPK